VKLTILISVKSQTFGEMMHFQPQALDCCGHPQLSGWMCSFGASWYLPIAALIGRYSESWE
jgi:hypothetical protein